MATYTTTRVLTRPNTSTQWPSEVHPGRRREIRRGDAIYHWSETISNNELTLTGVTVWKSKEDFYAKRADKDSDHRDELSITISNQIHTYMALNDITGKSTEEDGTVRVFNASNKTWEVQE